MHSSVPDPPTRHTFLGAIGLLFGAVAGSVLVVAGRFIGNSFTREAQTLVVSIGSADGLTDRFQRFVVALTRRDAWIEQDQRKIVYARLDGDRAPEAFLGDCSHMGCPLSWNDAENQFECPCHQGTFDARGQVTGGPPSAPMRRLVVRVDDGIAYVEFPGVS